MDNIFSICGKNVGKGEPTYVIAEVAWSHDGELQKAKKIVKGAIDAEADAICFHLTSMENYMVKDYHVPGSGASSAADAKSLYDFLVGKNLSDSDWKELFSQTKSGGLHVLIMANDEASFNLAQGLNTDGYVIAPATMGEFDLLRKISNSGKPLFIRTGGATLLEIERTIKIAKDSGNKNIILIHGFQSFPTSLEEMNLHLIESMKKKFDIPVGFADHTDGGSSMALTIPLVAIGAGADLIEKHLTHDRSLKGIDFESALNPDDLSKLIENIHEIDKSLGSAEWKQLSDKENRYREVVRKHIVASRDIKQGEEITREAVAFKRANGGFYAEEINSVIGKKAKMSIRKDDEIRESTII